LKKPPDRHRIIKSCRNGGFFLSRAGGRIPLDSRANGCKINNETIKQYDNQGGTAIETFV
jgi:hypothetical protein